MVMSELTRALNEKIFELFLIYSIKSEVTCSFRFFVTLSKFNAFNTAARKIYDSYNSVNL